MQPAKVFNPLQDKKLKKNLTQKKLKILIAIGVLMLVLFIVIFIAAARKGGIENLFKGSSNPISNTISNIGTTFTQTPGSDPSPRPVSFTDSTNVDPQVEKESVLQNYISFDTFNNGYDVTIKKNTFVYFSNLMDTRIGLKFSDGRDLKLGSQEEKNMIFNQKGNFTFKDVIDNSGEPITGIVRVVD